MDGNISLLKLGGGLHGSEPEHPQSDPETQSILKVVNRIGHLERLCQHANTWYMFGYVCVRTCVYACVCVKGYTSGGVANLELQGGKLSRAQ